MESYKWIYPFPIIYSELNIGQAMVGMDDTGLISIGLRWAPENFAVDFGLIRPLEEAGSLIGIPWLGVTIPFGHVIAD